MREFFTKLKDLLSLSPVFMTRQQKIRFAIFMLSLTVLGVVLPSKFTISLTKSLDHRIYYISRFPSPSEMKLDDYGVFFIRSKYFKNGEPIRLIKQIACDEGNVLIEINRHYYCVYNPGSYSVDEIRRSIMEGKALNGIIPRYIGRAKEYSLKGEPLEKFDFTGVIPTGKTFMAGHHKDSFDSRYWGLLDKKEFIAKAYPIF